MKRLAAWLMLINSFGCTALTPFDPNGQPCELNAAPGRACLEGFECVATGPDAGLCQSVDAGTR